MYSGHRNFQFGATMGWKNQIPAYQKCLDINIRRGHGIEEVE